MAVTKTFRLTADQAAWLAAEAKHVRLSEQRIIEALIDGARQNGWQIMLPQADDQ